MSEKSTPVAGAPKYQSYLFVAILFMLTGTMAAMNNFKIPMIMTDIAATHNMEMTTASWLMAIFTFIGIFLALPAGGFAQKFGPKAMVVVGAFFVAGGSVIGAFAGSGQLLIFSRAVEGVGFCLISVCGPLAVSKYVEPSKVGSAIGIWVMWVCLGQVIAFAVTPPLYVSMGLSGVWNIFAAATVIMALAVVFLIKEPTGLAASTADAEEAAPATMRDIMGNKNVWLLVIAFMLFNVVLLSIIAFGPVYLEERGVDVSAIAFATSIPMFLALVASPVFGVLMDKLGTRKKLLILALVVIGPCTAMFFSSTGAVMYIGLVVFGLIGFGTPAAAVNSVGVTAGRPQLIGLAMGLFMVMQFVGMFLGSLLMPYLLEMTNGNWTTSGMVLIPIGLLSAVLVALAKYK